IFTTPTPPGGVPGVPVVPVRSPVRSPVPPTSATHLRPHVPARSAVCRLPSPAAVSPALHDQPATLPRTSPDHHQPPQAAGKNERTDTPGKKEEKNPSSPPKEG